MRNETGEMVQDHSLEAHEPMADWKDKARTAGAAALDATKSAYRQLQEKSSACTKATDQAIRENPYVSLGIAFGLGALLGFFIFRGGSGD